jgi:hypothetical protein
MADPLSLVAIAGLAYAGKKLSESRSESYQGPEIQVQQRMVQEEVPSVSLPRPTIVSNVPDRKIELNNFSDIVPQTRSSGGEVLEMRNRMFDGGRMNNLSPIEKQLVGPGIAVGPDVPAAGGFHQLVRVNPENVGAHRLTTLPGRSGPAFDIYGGRRGKMGEMGHNRPEKTAYLPTRLPPGGGRSQGFGGHIPRGEHVSGKRITNRAQDGLRDDALGFGGAKRIVSAVTHTPLPTRNKKDGNIEQYGYNNQVAPNISHFKHGYEMSPGVKIGEKRTYGTPHTVQELMKYGFRPDDRRGKANRAGNAGRMNVRAGPLNQGGLATNMRSDTTRVDGRTGPIDGAWTQQYRNDQLHNFNSFKGNVNPYATDFSLGVAKKQLQNNPIAQKIM